MDVGRGDGQSTERAQHGPKLHGGHRDRGRPDRVDPRRGEAARDGNRRSRSRCHAGLRRHPLAPRLDRAARRWAGTARSQTFARERHDLDPGGNCGISPAPLGSSFNRGAIEQMLLVGSVTADLGWSWSSVREYLDEIERRGPATLQRRDLCRPQRCAVPHARRIPACCDADAELAEMEALRRTGSRRQRPSGSLPGSSTFRAGMPGRRDRAARAGRCPEEDALVAVHTRGISELYDRAIDEAIGSSTRR